MSYINEALKKAQRDRDSRYERFGGIIASGPVRKKKPFKSFKRKFAIGSAIALVVLIPTGLFITFYILQQPSSLIKGSSPHVNYQNNEIIYDIASKDKDPMAIPEVNAGGTVQGEQTGVPQGEAPKKTVQADGKPIPYPAAASPGGLLNQREAEVRYMEALTAQRGGDHKKAEDLYQRVLMLDPGHVRALNNLGVLFMDQKKKREAVALFDRAIVLKKDYVDPYYNLACIYARMDEIDESIRYLKMAIAINKDVKNWAEKDADMKSVTASAAFKKIMEGQKY
jgi:tetratricopeptide (TPR) repeat protein